MHVRREQAQKVLFIGFNQNFNISSGLYVPLLDKQHYQSLSLNINNYALLLIFPLIYKYQQLNLFKLHCKCQQALCAHYSWVDSVMQIPCEKPTLKFTQIYLNLSEYSLGNITYLVSFVKRELFCTLSVVNLLINGFNPGLEMAS